MQVVIGRRRFLRRLLVGSALVPLAVACGGSPPASPTAPVATPPPPPTPLPSPTAVPSPSPTPLPAAMKRSIQALAFSTDNRGQPQGSTSPIGLTVTPGAKEEFRLGFFETDVGQLGPSWRAAGWMAALFGTLETGKDLTTMRVSWETKGYVDGPSAGGLMTTAFISALQGDTLKTDIGMTGTINPDGTIGPVGGIQYKLDAAAKEKMTTVLIPLGQRSEVDQSTDKAVDLVAKGQSLGITVKEIATLDEAYEALTGKTLPRGTMPNRAPDLSNDAYDKIKPKIAEWGARYNEEIGRYKRALPDAQSYLADQATDADGLYKKSQQALNEGSIAVAYELIQQAVVAANATSLGTQAIEVVLRTRDVGQAAAAVLKSSGNSQADTMIDRLKAYPANTPSDALMAIVAWSHLLEAVALDDSAANSLAAAKKNRDQQEALGQVVTAAVLISSETWLAKAADDLLTFNFAKSGSSQKVDPTGLETWAGLFKSVAQANQSYFDALILDEVAKGVGLRLEQVEDVFATKDMGYMVASYGASPAAGQYLEKALGKTPTLSIAQLGFSIGSYLATSQLIAKYYSLDAQIDDDGNLTGFGRERALTAMLDNAADRAKERIAAADKSGADVTLPILEFQSARAHRERGPDEKLTALRSYWAASLYARLLTLMGQATV